MGDEPDGRAACAALRRLDPDGSGRLKMLLAWAKHKKPGFRAYAVLRLAAYEGARAGPAHAAVLGALLHDEHWLVRMYADAAVEDFGPDAMIAVPALTLALQDEDLNVRQAAARSLGAIGPPASASVVALCNALRDSDGGVRSYACEALEKVGNVEAGAAVLLANLHDPDVNIRFVTACVLAKSKPCIALAVPALCDSMVAGEEFVGGIRRDYVRCRSAQVLGEIGPEARAAVPALLLALTDPYEGVRGAAADAMKMIDPATAAHVLYSH